MKNRFFLIAALASVCLMFSNCATTHPSNIGFGAFISVTEPVAVGPSTGNATKTGISVATNVLGIAAIGDCSINTAAKNGRITNIKTVDRKVTNILGIFGKVETIVTGE